jgi:aspartate dehydrogenase
VRIALVGLGAIGQEVLRRLAAGAVQVQVTGALVAHPERSRACAAFSRVEQLLDSAPDLVVECARQHVLREVGAPVLAAGRSMLVASVGALADERTYEALMSAAQRGGAQILVPAGALAGIDALAAARHVGLASVRYTRRAPPSTWVKSGALDEAAARRIDAAHALFEGNAREAAQRYPKNANVAATIALAGVGFERTRVTLLADPAAAANVHVLEAEGGFGRFSTELCSTSIAGSTSSAIVAGSLVRAILSRTERISV